MRAAVKAEFLAAVAGARLAPPIGAPDAVALLGTMLGGYNVAPWWSCSTTPPWVRVAAEQLASTLLVFDAFHDVADRASTGNPHAVAVMRSWAAAEWFTRRPSRACGDPPDRLQGRRRGHDRRPVARARRLVHGPTSRCTPCPSWRTGRTRATPSAGSPSSRPPDGLSPSSATWSAPARRARARSTRCCGTSATTSPSCPNKRHGGVVIGSQDRPHLLQHPRRTPAPCRSSATSAGMATGDHIVLRPHDGRIETPAGELLAGFALRSDAARRGPGRRTGPAHHRPDT